ncbi:MAG: M48 family metallopeptidase [Desulfovibrionaceae bacterium]|jgi:predicted metal-dependent hydrolase|nr:M48 family metallopeptidase [Desulfovibrionaceae bacterium]
MQQLPLDLFGHGDAPPPAIGASRLPAPEITANAVAPLSLPQALTPARFTHPRANRAIALGDAQVAYQLRRGRRRSIGFTVGADGLTVSAPHWTTLAQVDAALRDKQGWIVAKLGQARERQQRLESARIDWKEGASVPFLGQPVILLLDPRQSHGRGGAVLDASCAGAAPPGAPPLTLRLGLPRTAAPEQLRDITQAWLMRQARRVFTARLDYFAPQLGVRWQRLTLSSAGTRWGSASADGSIRLNWRLIHLRETVIDYVVVHELAHLREMNHGPRFWQIVESVVPDLALQRGALQGEALPVW